MKKLTILLLTLLLSASLFAASENASLEVSTVIAEVNTLEFRLNGNKVEAAEFNSNGQIENLTVVLNSNKANGNLPTVKLTKSAMTNGSSTIDFAVEGVNSDNVFGNAQANATSSTTYTSEAITLTMDANQAKAAVAGTYIGSVTVEITSAN